MSIIAIDAGNHEVKVVGDKGPDRFLSLIGEAAERSVVQKWSDDDMEWRYDGHMLGRGFAGTLAQYESFLACSTFGDTKLHEDARLRVMLALHRYTADRAVRIMVGQPIGTHQRDKADLKAYLEGTHTLTVNGVTKTFHITRVEVGIEGGASFFAKPKDGLVRIIDAGSGTVNLATLRDKRYQNRESRTLPFGLETLRSAGMDAIARRICQEARADGWGKDDEVRIIGGSAAALTPAIGQFFPEARPFHPTIGLRDGTTQKVDPVYANAAGLYAIGKQVFQ